MQYGAMDKFGRNLWSIASGQIMEGPPLASDTELSNFLSGSHEGMSDGIYVW